MKKIIILLFGFFLTFQANAQFGYGLTASTGLYARYSNPVDTIAARSVGSALLNLGIGPKLWLGGEKFSFSTEGQVILSPLAFSLGDFKGLGAVSFPIMAKLNFGGLSNVNKEGKFGLSIGAGIEWTKTELFGLTNKFETLGVERPLFKTYIGQLAYGFGMSGFSLQVYARYGYNSDTKARLINVGIAYDFNLKLLEERTNPDF